MTCSPPPTRRTVICAGAAGLAAAGTLTGCGLLSGGSSGTSGGAGDAAGTTTGSPAESDGGSQQGITLASVPVGGFVAATGADGKPVIVARPQQGTVVAFSAVCTHMGCQVVPTDGRLSCPCHGSQFDGLTGRVLAGPAKTSLPAVTVTVRGERITAA